MNVPLVCLCEILCQSLAGFRGADGKPCAVTHHVKIDVCHRLLLREERIPGVVLAAQQAHLLATDQEEENGPFQFDP